MVILHRYDIVTKKDGVDECVASDDSVRCSRCGGVLLCRDKKMRKYKDTDGTTRQIRIRRMKCMNCKHLHSELPDFLIPYKQHIISVVENYVEETVLGEELLRESIPDSRTRKNWYFWIISILKSIKENRSQYGSKLFFDSPIKITNLIKKSEWLLKFVDMIVNCKYYYG